MTQIEDLLARVQKLENEMYSRGFWEKPKPTAPEPPTAIPTESDYWDEPNTDHVHIRYTIDCPCGMTHDGLSIRVRNDQINPFRHVYVCDKAGPVSVFFHRQKGTIHG